MLVALPNTVSFQDGAAAMLQGMTAHYLTHSTYPLKKGETTLIHAAAGGVGQLLVQMGKQNGARGGRGRGDCLYPAGLRGGDQAADGRKGRAGYLRRGG